MALFTVDWTYHNLWSVTWSVWSSLLEGCSGGSRGGSPPLIFGPNWGPKDQKNFVGTPASPPPSFISRSGSGTGLCLPNFYSGMDYVLWYWNDPELLPPWSASLSLYSKSMHYEYQHCALVCLHECVLTPLRR